MHVDEDNTLSLSAVGLWHKLHHRYGRLFDAVDILTVHPDPNAWGPFDEEHDLDGPLNELLAQGYAQEVEGFRIGLFEEID